MSAQPRSRFVRAALTLTIATVGATAVACVHGAPARAQTVTLPPSGAIRVVGNGNGHGHGMSQYGARGAAIAGLSAAQIVAFYYPGTTLATISASTLIRVLLSGATADTCVQAKTGLTATGISGTLNTSGVSRFRFVPSGSGFALQKTSGSSCISGTWTNVASGLPSSADIASAQGYVRLYRADGTSTDYRGRIGAVRSGSGQITVNRVGLDQYAQGVVPREMPASWQAAAVQAQAIAARTYGEYEREHAGGAYDICDTTSCQVYGGGAHYDASGTLLWQDDPAAIGANAGRYLKYGNGAAFSQFSASDGGWTVDGGQPYLVAKADPYDTTASGDPYLHWTRSVPVSQVASAYGFSHATQIQITKRDGHGEWGGRVLAATIVGTDSTGHAKTVTDTGFGLQDAMGLPHNWFTFPDLVPSDLGGTIVHSTNTMATVFYNSSGHLLTRNWVSGSGWQPITDLGAPPSGLTWDPDAASWGAEHIDVVARDGGGRLVNRSFTEGTGWTAWRSNNVTVSSSPTVVDPVPNEGDVFWLGPNHTLQTIRWTKAAGWSSPSAVPGVSNDSSGPDATALAMSKNVVVAYLGTDGRFWTVTRAAEKWQTPTAFNPAHALPVTPAHLDPAIANAGGDNPTVYYTATNGLVYDSNASGVWNLVPGSGTTSAPDAWTDLPTHGDVVSGHNGVLGSASWTQGDGWRPWQPLP